MVQQATAGVPKGDGKAARVIAPPAVVSYNRPDTGRVARLERGQTWIGWVCEENG
jgi:hypothetical protein